MSKPRTFGVTIAILFLACALGPLARAGTLSTDVIGMFPRNAGEFAYADLRQARALSWFPQLQSQMLPARFKEFEKFLSSAGVDPNVQVEEVAWALVPGGLPDGPAAANSTAVPTSEEVVGVALGSFSPDSTEAIFQAKKLPVVKVRDYSLYGFGGGSGASDLFFVFLDANTAVFGQRSLVERLINIRNGDEQGLYSNGELSALVAQANGSGVVWSVMSAAYTRLAMQQLTPELSQFPQTAQLTANVQALTISITASSGVEAHFQAVLDNPDDANTFAALLQAGLLYRRYQVANTNPDLANMLDGIRVAPSGDDLDIRLSLTDDQVAALIRRNTFAIGL
jgi:hypothetical protein